MKNGKFIKENPTESHTDSSLEQENPIVETNESISSFSYEACGGPSEKMRSERQGEELETEGDESRQSQSSERTATDHLGEEEGKPVETGTVSLTPDKLSEMLHEAYLRGRNENIEARIDAECTTRRMNRTATDLLIRGLAGAARTLFRPGRKSIWPKHP